MVLGVVEWFGPQPISAAATVPGRRRQDKGKGTDRLSATAGFHERDLVHDRSSRRVARNG
jgi:hypothetical protein